MGQHILLCGNTSWGMFNFRQGLFKALIEKGHKVTIVAPRDDTSKKLEDMGCNFINLKISAKGINPFEDLGLIIAFTKIYRNIKPDLIFHYTIKPNIYGSVAAKLSNIPSIAITTGLGYTFQKVGFVAIVARLLYSASFRFPEQVWFLNQDDMDAFLGGKLVKNEKAYLLDSEGVNTEHFIPQTIFNADGKTRFLLVARMLWDKGVGEFVQSARIVRAKHPNAIFQLLGEADSNNPRSISRREIREWEREGVIEYLGTTDDVRPILGDADCVVLPSYREGVPRTLLEAAAMSKPIITTNAVGCKEAIIDNQTGWLCEPRSVKSLTSRFEYFLMLSDEKRREIGHAAGEYVRERFDEKIIIDKYMLAIFNFVNKS